MVDPKVVVEKAFTAFLCAFRDTPIEAMIQQYMNVKKLMVTGKEDGHSSFMDLLKRYWSSYGGLKSHCLDRHRQIMMRIAGEIVQRVALEDVIDFMKGIVRARKGPQAGDCGPYAIREAIRSVHRDNGGTEQDFNLDISSIRSIMKMLLFSKRHDPLMTQVIKCVCERTQDEVLTLDLLKEEALEAAYPDYDRGDTSKWYEKLEDEITNTEKGPGKVVYTGVINLHMVFVYICMKDYGMAFDDAYDKLHPVVVSQFFQMFCENGRTIPPTRLFLVHSTNHFVLAWRRLWDDDHEAAIVPPGDVDEISDDMSPPGEEGHVGMDKDDTDGLTISGDGSLSTTTDGDNGDDGDDSDFSPPTPKKSKKVKREISNTITRRSNRHRVNRAMKTLVSSDRITGYLGDDAVDLRVYYGRRIDNTNTKDNAKAKTSEEYIGFMIVLMRYKPLLKLKAKKKQMPWFSHLVQGVYRISNEYVCFLSGSRIWDVKGGAISIDTSMMYESEYTNPFEVVTHVVNSDHPDIIRCRNMLEELYRVDIWSYFSLSRIEMTGGNVVVHRANESDDNVLFTLGVDEDENDDIGDRGSSDVHPFFMTKSSEVGGGGVTTMNACTMDDRSSRVSSDVHVFFTPGESDRKKLDGDNEVDDDNPLFW